MPMALFGQTYASLWKKVADAEKDDLPRTQYDFLMKIVDKADKEHDYGQLLKAELSGARVMADVAPDSLPPAVERIIDRWKAQQDDVMKAVYQTVLHRICVNNRSLELTVDSPELTPELMQKLAAVKTNSLKPMVIEQTDSKIFENDLLSVIGYEQHNYRALHDFYEQAGNRRAALITALEMLKLEAPAGRVDLDKVDYLERLDSLITCYQDVAEVGEVVIERYQYMDKHTNATVEEKWQYVNWALDKYGSWKRMNVLRQAQRDLSARQFNAEVEWRVCYSGMEQKVKLTNLRNITKLTMRVYRAKVDGDTDLRPDVPKDYRQLKPLLTLLPELTVTRQYIGKTEYELTEDSMMIAALPVGVYMVEMEATPDIAVSRQLYYVSDLRLMSESQPDNTTRYVVVNAETGQPVSGAQVRLTYYMGYKKKDRVETLTTNADGEVLKKHVDRQPSNIFVYKDGDRALPDMRNYSTFNYNGTERIVERTELMTDRAIYRPGQTVHVAGFVYTTENGYVHKAKQGVKRTLTLYDANHKEVDRKDLVTDEFGSFSTDFTLPSSGLTGYFRINTWSTSCSFRVEEYKRPTFEVEFSPVNQSYEDGDTVEASALARTYSGAPVQGAKVSYKIVRRRSWWWASYSYYWSRLYLGNTSSEEVVGEGIAVTGDDGKFTVRMPMILPKTDYPMFYNFVCTADVTDMGGETHQAQLSLPLGNRKTAFSVDLPEQALASEMPDVVLHLRNAAGVDVPAEARYRIDGGKWKTANTQEPLKIPALKSGTHTLEAICKEDTLKRDFVVFSLDDQVPATQTDDWFYQSATQFPRDGKPVVIQVGSSAPDVHMVYTIACGNQILERGFVKRSNQLLNRKFTYKEEYRNGLLLTFAWVKNGRCYRHETTIQRPTPDERLMLEWSTFRDRLQPGQQEEWSLTVRKPDGTPAHAQLMAVLYDKSLDQITLHQWGFAPYLSLPLPDTQWSYVTWGMLRLKGYSHQGNLYAPQLSFSHFDSDAYPDYWSSMHRMVMYEDGRALGAAPGRVLSKSAKMESAPMLQSAVLDEEAAVASNAKAFDAAETRSTDQTGTDQEGTGEVQVRENLQETAFFYPQLVTDSVGAIQLRFTLPESLTTWKFMGLAHTTDMCHGMLSGEAVAQKDVMIQPNVPRFIREGDAATLTARIINLGEKEVSGTARLLLVDPETEKTVHTLSQPFTLSVGATSGVVFNLPSSDVLAEGLYIVKVTASGQGFSDGEQHYLPVLPSRERVTVSVPFTQNESGIKTINLAKLVPEATTHSKLTIEYTNNPAWLMIQALPSLAHPHDDCAICQAASLYSNSIGRFIIKQNPHAKTVFQQWKQEPDEGSLQSALEKNQELKNLVLNETPWVLDADRESEQKQRVADFFDTNLMDQRLASALEKLRMLQCSNGGWTWWPQMPASVYMTVSVSEMMVRLNEMTGEQPETREMLTKAFKFLGKEMVDLVKEMKKEERKGYKQVFPSFTALQWLYICAIDGRQLPSSVQEANQYLIKLLKKETKNQTIYEKAMSAIILNSPLYIKSLKEYTVYKEEMGRYYDTPRAGYSWRNYRIPTQVAAIEALQRLNPEDQQTIDEMRRWLLQEKRTQAWDTPLNSVDAVYAFLNGHQEALKAQPHSVIKIDGAPLELPKATAGLGYVKTAMPAEGKKELTVEKTSEGTSWGAVYAQFMQSTHDIAQSSSGIVVKREIMKKDGSPLESLQVGDRVVIRITIQTERDLDFVQVNDKRAACLEPVNQLSGYRYGYYTTPRDNCTNYYYYGLAKGKHVLETEYYVDRAGRYETGTCTVECAYAPEYRGMTPSQTLVVKNQ